GLSFTAGTPGMKPNSPPPTTSTIGYGIDSHRAIAPRPATPTSRPAMSSSALPTAEVRRDVAGEQLDLVGRGVDRPEHEHVEAVVHETGERLDPPVGRSGERFTNRRDDRDAEPGGKRRRQAVTGSFASAGAPRW